MKLIPIEPAAADAILAGRVPDEPAFAPGYPTEFSAGVAQSVGSPRQVGSFFAFDEDEAVVVGEIGGAEIEPGTIEIGYAIVDTRAGRGHATAAVQALVRHLRDRGAAGRVIAHTPTDRPASGRVLEKAGFSATGVVEDEHEGEILRVTRWELPL